MMHRNHVQMCNKMQNSLYLQMRLHIKFVAVQNREPRHMCVRVKIKLNIHVETRQVSFTILLASEK